MLARALPMVVAPMLTVLFTSRSGHRSAGMLQEQLKLLGFYSFGLAVGTAGLLLLRGLWVKLIFGKATPESAAMLWPLSFTMVFVGLVQALGTWALASRWIKTSLLYGGLGLGYWLTLLALGKTPAMMLKLMPLCTGVAFATVFVVWFWTMRTHPPDHPAEGLKV
jgi:hypothetical protein